jgi:hypothetical protein
MRDADSEGIALPDRRAVGSEDHQPQDPGAQAEPPPRHLGALCPTDLPRRRRAGYVAPVPARNGRSCTMTVQQIDARLRRLQALAMGLRREHQRIGTGDDPLTPQERYDYAAAIRAAATALEAARVPLENAAAR